MARIGFALLALSATAALPFGFGACSSAPKLVQQGGECFQATDCAAGLVCLAQKDNRSICDSDLSGVQKTEDAAAPRVDGGQDAGRDGDAGRSDAATIPDAAGDAPAQDAASE